MNYMSTPKPQTKASELINHLVLCLSGDIRLEPLELKRIERDATKLPSYHDRSLVLGLLSSYANDFPSAKDHFYNAIRSSESDTNTYEFLLVCYDKFRKTSQIKGVILTALERYPNSVKLNRYLLDMAGKSLDVLKYAYAANKLKKMDKYIPFEESDSVFSHLFVFLDGLGEARDEGVQQIKLVGDEVLKLCEDFELRIIAQTIQQLEDDYISCFYEVISNKQDVESFDLNWQFAGRVVNEGLFKAPVTITFKLIDKESLDEH